MTILQSLPDDTPFDKIADEIEKVCFMASVQRGLDQLDSGEKIPHSEVKKKIAEWLER
jgi:predicted transcriptional regulator